jgi:nucleotide-binding universal stress UspA family protein
MSSKVGSVMAGVDASDGARHALEWAISFARAFDAEVLAVHAAGLLTHLDEGPPTPSQSHLAELRQTFTEAWCSPLLSADVAYRTEMLQGPPVAALLEVAERDHVDLIVLGRRGSGARHDLLIGSTCHQVAERSRRPVVIVPPPS